MKAILVFVITTFLIFSAVTSLRGSGRNNYLDIDRDININQNVNEKVSKKLKTDLDLEGNIGMSNGDATATGKNTLAEVYNSGKASDYASSAFGNAIAASNKRSGR